MRFFDNMEMESLIEQDKVEIDKDSITNFIAGKRILITGGAGSIGLELAIQILTFQPGLLVIYDIDETAMFESEVRIRNKFPEINDSLVCAIGDIKDYDRLNEIFANNRPEIVYHAAAYKHIPMMEKNAGEAVKVNIIGSHKVITAAKENHVKKLIIISTDKAVKPSSVMGATKRLAEYIGKAYNNINGIEIFSVRFGNVLGSRGSILPLFTEQIKCGGPLTVTHKEMERYVMTIPNVVSLLLQATVIGKGGETLIFDMGKPIKILKFAEDLIRLHGYEPYRDIDIKITGLRPGEKIHEELLTAEEGSMAAEHKKIFKARISEDYSLNEIEKIVEEFKESVYLKNGGEKEIKNTLKKHIKWYQGAINSEH